MAGTAHHSGIISAVVGAAPDGTPPNPTAPHPSSQRPEIDHHGPEIDHHGPGVAPAHEGRQQLGLLLLELQHQRLGASGRGNIIEAPWLVNDGHGASFRQHNDSRAWEPASSASS
jgi:hypothetical protein